VDKRRKQDKRGKLDKNRLWVAASEAAEKLDSERL
jgi:hypothetical protein